MRYLPHRAFGKKPAKHKDAKRSGEDSEQLKRTGALRLFGRTVQNRSLLCRNIATSRRKKKEL